MEAQINVLTHENLFNIRNSRSIHIKSSVCGNKKGSISKLHDKLTYKFYYSGCKLLGNYTHYTRTLVDTVLMHIKCFHNFHCHEINLYLCNIFMFILRFRSITTAIFSTFTSLIYLGQRMRGTENAKTLTGLNIKHKLRYSWQVTST